MERPVGLERACRGGEAPDVGEVIVPGERIMQRLDELAAEIAAAYPGGELTLLAVMNGALFFLADLARRLPMRVELTTVRVRSYRGREVRPGGAEIVGELCDDLSGREVLIVDDILDTGSTLDLVAEAVTSQRPASCRVCVLLRKGRPDARPARADFVGFDIPDRFVVGYGLDLDGWGRNLTDIVALTEDAGDRK